MATSLPHSYRMPLFISSLNSGSNGNCYYVGNDREAVLIDAGISCREIEVRMHRLGLSLQRVKAIFVSHEHGDHIRGVTQLTKKYQLPVFITPRTLQNARLSVEKITTARSLRSDEPVWIGGLCITAFPKFHDAADPHSFMITHLGINVGVFTDIGAPCERLIHHFSQCHAAFLEANYDEQLLSKRSYPPVLKQRIRGGNGHLSNQQALALFRSHKPDYMSHVLLSHLSKENNCPELLTNLFRPHTGNTSVTIASRYKETPIYAIGPATMASY